MLVLGDAAVGLPPAGRVHSRKEGAIKMVGRGGKGEGERWGWSRRAGIRVVPGGVAKMSIGT